MARIYGAAAHVLNMTPTRVLSWKSPLQVLTHHLGVTSLPCASHLRLLGSKAFVLKSRIPNGHKLDPRAAIGWLVGYEASNIWRIWVSELQRVIRARDVIFDETIQFHPFTASLGADVRQVAHIADAIHIPPRKTRIAHETPPIAYFDDDPRASVAPVHLSSSPAGPPVAPSLPLEVPTQLPTPSPEPSLSPEPRRPAGPSQAAHLALGGTQYTDFAYVFSAFADATDGPRPHQSDIPPPPRSWKELAIHPYGPNFRHAADEEYQKITTRGTWESVSRLPGKQVLPVL